MDFPGSVNFLFTANKTQNTLTSSFLSFQLNQTKQNAGPVHQKVAINHCYQSPTVSIFPSLSGFGSLWQEKQPGVSALSGSHGGLRYCSNPFSVSCSVRPSRKRPDKISEQRAITGSIQHKEPSFFKGSSSPGPM